MRTFALWVLAGVFVIGVGGCVSPYDPAVHETRLKRIEQTHEFQPVDLDGDGRDELVRRGQDPEGNEQSILIQTLTGRAVAQVHFAGRLPSLNFVDVTQDGRLEIVAPVVQGDSMFYNVVSADGEKLRRFFAVSGRPHRKLNETVGWDLRGADVHIKDVAKDGTREFVSLFTTGFARQPRGVWVHAYPEGTLLGRQRIGALVRDGYFGDVDDDAAPEWLFGSIATNNGAEAGDISDAKAHLGRIDVTTPPQIAWTRVLGGTFSEVVLRHGDLDGEGQLEFVALRTPREGRQTKSPLHQIDPATGETLQRYEPTAILRSVHVGTLGDEGRDRVLIRDAEGTLRILNRRFEVVRRRSFDTKIQFVQVLPDVNGDNQAEIVVSTGRGALWLAPDLSTRAATTRGGSWRVIQTGIGRSPRVAITSGSGSMTHFRVAENEWWWVYRYGPGAGIVMGIVVVLGGGIVLVRRYRRGRLQEAVRERVVAHADREWLLFHVTKGISTTSAGARRVLGLDEERPLTRHRLREQRPELAAYLGAVAGERDGPQADELTIDGRAITVTRTPLEVVRAGHPYWMVWLDSEGETERAYRAQGLMAQRVAHDLKNPLTSILLTLQRMQMAYRDEAPELADTLDDYTERIEERIGSLRRMTTNVLKFVGKEEPRRTPTDLSAFLEDLGDTVEQGLPPDIELRRQFDDALPAVAVDQDQLRSVIENLVSNAVEAMPEGGVVTINTRLARDLYFDEKPARDHVVVEVLDTGVGMTADERERLFEPGFSTRDDTGLGMALVQKIIDDHGGHVEVESEPDVGTSITLYLPADPDASAASH